MPELLGHWAHVIINTLGSWLPGEPTGFRDHDHRVHSSGSVEHPSTTQHHGLYRYSREISSGQVSIGVAQRMPIAEALAEKFHALNCRVRIVSVSASHAHILADVGPDDAKPLVGRVKQAASHRVRCTMPGRV